MTQNSYHADRWKDNDKAGLIPYCFDENGVPKFLMMIASDPKFGGSRPMISKGTIEADEDAKSCAIREAIEELGLRENNMKFEPYQIFDQHVTLRSVEYDLKVFAVEIENASVFDPTGEETSSTLWVTHEQFNEIGRYDHQAILKVLVDTIEYQQWGDV